MFASILIKIYGNTSPDYFERCMNKLSEGFRASRKVKLQIHILFKERYPSIEKIIKYSAGNLKLKELHAKGRKVEFSPSFEK